MLAHIERKARQELQEVAAVVANAENPQALKAAESARKRCRGNLTKQLNTRMRLGCNIVRASHMLRSKPYNDSCVVEHVVKKPLYFEMDISELGVVKLVS